MLEPTEFVLQPRGRRRFDVWAATRAVDTVLGPIPVRILTQMDGRPDTLAVELATKLSLELVRGAPEARRIIIAHYRLAESEGWLEPWGVPGGLPDSGVLNYVRSIALNIHSFPAPRATLAVDPEWDPEHKLSLGFSGAVTAVNGSRDFEIDAGGVLRLLD